MIADVEHNDGFTHLAVFLDQLMFHGGAVEASAAADGDAVALGDLRELEQHVVAEVTINGMHSQPQQHAG